MLFIYILPHYFQIVNAFTAKKLLIINIRLIIKSIEYKGVILNMNPAGTTFSVTLLANAIADKLDNDQLELLAVILNQLGDTLATIVIQRNINNNK